jgi:hypothetical protein
MYTQAQCTTMHIRTHMAEHVYLYMHPARRCIPMHARNKTSARENVWKSKENLYAVLHVCCLWATTFCELDAESSMKGGARH